MKYDLSNDVGVEKFKLRAKFLIEKQSQVDLTQTRKARSISQNAYLHVVISLYSIEYGYTLDEGKTLLKRMCDFMIYEKEGHKFLKQTSKMDSKELTEFVEWIRNHSSNEGLYIPSSEEYLENKFLIDSEIDNHKSYL